MSMNLKNQLRTYLEHHGLTASQLSRKTGVPNATVADWLSGRKPRNLDQVRKVAEAFGTSIDHLVYGDGVEEKKQDQILDLEELMGDRWLSGVFELRLRRVKKTR